jgi:drug/metabolite transporter (DMT)-like permease
VGEERTGRRVSQKGIACLIVAAMGYGSLVVLIKWALRAGLNAETALALRFTIACLVWWVIAAAVVRPLWPGWRHAAGAATLGALFYAPNALCYYYGTSRVSGTLAAMAIALVPVLVALLARLFLGERLGLLGWLSLALAVVGTVMLAGGENGVADPLGLLGLGGAAVLYSLYIVLSAPVIRAISPLGAMPYVISGSTLFYWLWVALSGRLDMGFDPVGWWPIVVLALLPTVLAMFAFLVGSRAIGATRAAIVNSLEPVCGVMLAVIFLGDRPGWLQILGGVAVIAAALLVQVERLRHTRALFPVGAGR